MIYYLVEDFNIMKKCLFLLIICLLTAACYRESDVMLGTWIKPAEHNINEKEGFTLKKHGRAASVNLGQLKYEKWHVSDGTLVLSGKDSSTGITVDAQDIYIIRSVDKSLLVLTALNGMENIYYTRQQ